MKGTSPMVATPIGNSGDLSPRALDTLKAVDFIAAEDTRHSGQLLQHFSIQSTLIPYHEHNERSKFEQLIKRLLKGQSGALISDAGTPLISDPGYLLVQAAHQQQIPVVAVPGPCSMAAALSVSGLPTDKFLFEGFLPPKGQAREKRLQALAYFPHTMVFFEAPHRFLDFLTLAQQVFGDERLICVARELTKKHEQTYMADIKSIIELAEKGKIVQKGEFNLIVSGCPKSAQLPEKTAEMQQILTLLLEEVSIKKAVQLTKTLTGLPKNVIYNYALTLHKPEK